MNFSERKKERERVKARSQPHKVYFITQVVKLLGFFVLIKGRILSLQA